MVCFPAALILNLNFGRCLCNPLFLLTSEVAFFGGCLTNALCPSVQTRTLPPFSRFSEGTCVACVRACVCVRLITHAVCETAAGTHITSTDTQTDNPYHTSCFPRNTYLNNTCLPAGAGYPSPPARSIDRALRQHYYTDVYTTSAALTIYIHPVFVTAGGFFLGGQPARCLEDPG